MRRQSVILAVMGLGLFVSACGVVTSHTSSVPQSAVGASLVLKGVVLFCRFPLIP
jgi:hypothetical protein